MEWKENFSKCFAPTESPGADAGELDQEGFSM